MANIQNKTIPGSISLNDLPPENPFIRVGCSYYKTIRKTDRFKVNRVELKPWKSAEITLDYGKEFLKSIPKYNDFVMIPDNLNFQQIVDDCYNLYAPFLHKPSAGLWIWTERLIRQVFGEQYVLGLRYLQILYLHPDRSTVILALVSRERSTGKSTFLNWLMMLFGSNCALISSADFGSSFNGHYSNKNLILIEETLLEKSQSIEKLKALATQKQVQINEKHVQQFTIPFYGKIILTSNNEDKFAKIDQEEIRFFVRKLGKPEFENHNIEADLLNEIPAFLHYLTTLPPVDWSISRSGFTAAELKNESLAAVVKESRSGLFKDLQIYINDLFTEREDLQEFYATATDVKNKFFYNNSRIEPHYISTVLRTEFNLIPEKLIRYSPFEESGDTFTPTKPGRPFRFYRDRFVTSVTSVTSVVTA